MTPQSSFMILAAIDPPREAELRRLLASMNREPGVVDRHNSLIPFARFEGLHFARFAILDDQTTGDVAAYGLPKVDYPTYLAFLGDFDGSVETFLAELVSRAGDGLRRVFAHCHGFPPSADLLAWIKARSVAPAAMYVNWIGRTVRQVGEEELLRESLEGFLQANLASLRATRPRQAHVAMKEFVTRERQSGRVSLTPPEPTPLGWRVRNLLHLLGVPLLLVISAPFLLIYLPIFAIQLRRRERTDPVIAPRVDPAHASRLASLEDHDVTNQFTAMGSLKPGPFRRLTTVFVLWIINYAARHVFNRGHLARVTTIHFARWVFLDDGRRVLFASNYDGSLESYMDDFINKVWFGLNVVFGNGVGYPTTNWLILDGAKDEQKFKSFLRRHELTTEVWYNAHPGLTATDRRRNTLIREGLERPSMTDPEAREWLRLF